VRVHPRYPDPAAADTQLGGAGQLPPGVTLTGGHPGGTPVVAGAFTFTIEVTDGAADQAGGPGSIIISP
jgi:hypothetical protein